MVTIGLLVGAVAGCGGPLRAYPQWSLERDTVIDRGCVQAEAFVRMSGKTGVGMTVALRSHETCAVRFARAELVVDGARFPAELPAAQTLPGRSLVYAWLPFAFDNDAAWNDGKRRGQFEIEVVANDVTSTWIIPAHHDFLAGRWQDGSVR